jgi:hypothetical protein
MEKSSLMWNKFCKQVDMEKSSLMGNKFCKQVDMEKSSLTGNKFCNHEFKNSLASRPPKRDLAKVTFCPPLTPGQ